MLKKEKNIIAALAEGKKIYEIPDVGVFRTEKPSKTEPGQALSIQARVKLAEAGIGSLGVTDDMFDFDNNTSIETALQRELESGGIDTAEVTKMSVSELYFARMAMIDRDRLRSAAEKVEEQDAPPAAPELASAGPDAA